MSRRQMLQMRDPLEAIEAPQIVKKLFDAACLTKRERLILELRNGIDGNEMTADEIATIFHVTRGRVLQIESKALRKMRNPKIHAGILPRLEKPPGDTFDQHASKGLVE